MRQCLCWREGLMRAQQLEEEVDDDRSRLGSCVNLDTLLWLSPCKYLWLIQYNLVTVPRNIFGGGAGYDTHSTELRSGRQVPRPTMAPEGATATASPFIVISQQRDPGTFCGTDDVDLEDWLKTYERISAHNRWDPTIMLANVDNSLRGAARTWFRTNEETVTSWDDCKSKLRELFGNPVDRQTAAKKALASRVQTPTEPYVAYILDVLSLCQKADDQMAEADKVGHILKGIADDAFNLLMCKDCTTVQSVIKECRRFEQAKGRRLTTNFTRLPNTAPTSSCEDRCLSEHRPPETDMSPATTGSLTRLIRRELEAMAPTTLPQSETCLPSIPLIQAVVREEVAKLAFQPVCAVRGPGVHAPHLSSSYGGRNEYQPSTYRSRYLSEWRTPDDKPICFHCRRVGHVARYCQRRSPFSFRQDLSSYTHPSQMPRRFTPPPPPQPVDVNAPFRRYSRSPPPQRRQSRSPQPPRRPLSPTPYNNSRPEN